MYITVWNNMEEDTERDPAAVAELQSAPALHCTQLNRERERARVM